MLLVNIKQSVKHPELSGFKYLELSHELHTVDELQEIQFVIVELHIVHLKLVAFIESA